MQSLLHVPFSVIYTSLIHTMTSIYPKPILDVDTRLFLKKAFHCFQMALVSCYMQWSPLIETRIHCKLKQGNFMLILLPHTHNNSILHMHTHK